MLGLSVPALTGLQPVELGDVLFHVVCSGLKGVVLDVSSGGLVCWLSSICRTRAVYLISLIVQ
jgi:hypothetical protein